MCESRCSAPKLCCGRRSRWGGYLASDHSRDRATCRHNGTTELIMVRARTHMCHGTSPGNGSIQDAGMSANDGWIGIEMVKTFSRPVSQRQNPNRVGPIRKPGLDLLEKNEVQ